MKYSKHLATTLGIIILVMLICMADNFSDYPDTQMKVKTEQGIDTLITVKK